MKVILLFCLTLLLTACIDLDVILVDTAFNYSIHSSFDLSIQDMPSKVKINSITVDNTSLDEVYYKHESGELKLMSSYLTTLSLGDHQITVDTSDGTFHVDLTIIDTSRPYMVTKSPVVTDFRQDITFVFELFDGNIKSISGHSIRPIDYSISGNQLIIRRSFTQKVFNDEDTLETLTLGYSLEVGTHTVLGYLYIKSA